jgi:hypothetical protein
MVSMHIAGPMLVLPILCTLALLMGQFELEEVPGVPARCVVQEACHKCDFQEQDLGVCRLTGYEVVFACSMSKLEGIMLERQPCSGVMWGTLELAILGGALGLWAAIFVFHAV